MFITSCEKDENNEEPDELPSCGEIVDPRDGQVYKTILIGNVCWMAENLNVGVMINGAQNQTDNDTIEKYCYNDQEANCDVYGGLYQWNELMQYSTEEQTQGICPPGWHLPSDKDWKNMEMELGMSVLEADRENAWRGHGIGNAIKPGGYTGFNALYAGQRTSAGSFAYVENSQVSFAYFYTSSQAENNAFAWRRCLRPENSGIGRFDTFLKSNGFSVRCIKKHIE